MAARGTSISIRASAALCFGSTATSSGVWCWLLTTPRYTRRVITVATLDLKQAALLTSLRDLGSVIVAYSGGADSAYLAWAAHQALGDQAIAITADSASFPESHKRDAEEFARASGFRHEYITTREFENPDYVKNGPDRCFHCKDELFARLDEVARERGIAHVIYGVNVDV